MQTDVALELDSLIQIGTNDERLLLEIMDNCMVIQSIFEQLYEDLDFSFEYENECIAINYEYGNLDLRAFSASESFYYEEYWGNRYLHSCNTECVIEE